MRVLRLGASGDDVRAWQLFLRGQDAYEGIVNGEFDADTLAATKAWQQHMGLVPDGVVGIKTYGKAQVLGFDPGFSDDDHSELGPAWPPKPGFAPLNAAGREQLFGKFAFRPAPTPDNPEAIQITDDWEARHIRSVSIPQLVGVPGAHPEGRVRLHELAVAPFRAFFQAVDDAGLRGRLLSFAGTWVPRFIRGSRTELSNHAYGSAMDLNVAWNRLGTVPALKGKTGSLRELVPIANELGIYWGGHFAGRPDGMHFEVAQVQAPVG